MNSIWKYLRVNFVTLWISYFLLSRYSNTVCVYIIIIQQSSARGSLTPTERLTLKPKTFTLKDTWRAELVEIVVPQPTTAPSSAGRRAPWEPPAASAPAAAPSACGAATWSSASTPTPTWPPSPSDSAWSGTPWTPVHVRRLVLLVYSDTPNTPRIELQKAFPVITSFHFIQSQYMAFSRFPDSVQCVDWWREKKLFKKPCGETVDESRLLSSRLQRS